MSRHLPTCHVGVFRRVAKFLVWLCRHPLDAEAEEPKAVQYGRDACGDETKILPKDQHPGGSHQDRQGAKGMSLPKGLLAPMEKVLAKPCQRVAVVLIKLRP